MTDLAVAENVRRAKIITNVDVSAFSPPNELRGVKLQVIGRDELFSLAKSDQLRAELSEVMDEFIEAPMEGQFTPAPPTTFAPLPRRNFDPDLAIKQLQDCPVLRELRTRRPALTQSRACSPLISTFGPKNNTISKNDFTGST
ncbi:MULTISPECIES: hypothetical protein [Rhizobium]|uniref:hypothetical protein n=1 Tax=Rhizobium TaxID=379 RepID=UPI00102FAA83|nr:hypothetical protein [Rhizobium ruizarguesonis]TBB36003.1 hypothetical protein ELH46_37700 [Rhizobium ruizarguesonis]